MWGDEVQKADIDKICEILDKGGFIYLNPADYLKIVAVCLKQGLVNTAVKLRESQFVPAGMMVVHADT